VTKLWLLAHNTTVRHCERQNARFPYLQYLVLLTLYEKLSQSVLLCFRQEDISSNEIVKFAAMRI